MANRLLEMGVYVIGFSFPVVPKGQARIRTQMSVHSPNRNSIARSKRSLPWAASSGITKAEEPDEALVQKRSFPRIWMMDVPEPQGARTIAHQDREDRHLRHRHAHLQVG